MRIAVVGSGIAGLASAWLLARDHEVVVYEAADRLGGHTHTHDIELEGSRLAVDTGFIVCNPDHYPLFFRMLAELGIATRPTTMSFALRNDRSGLEYNASSLDTLFVQRRRLLSPRHWRMVRDILRFYREAPALLAHDGPGPELGEWLDRGGYSEGFRDDHLVPMASALWSSSGAQVLRFPLHMLVGFMANHQMLQVEGRPQWRVVEGGSSAYVRELLRRWRARVRLGDAVRSVVRDGTGTTVTSLCGQERYDHAVLACHSDQALALLGNDASTPEREILSAIGYQSNDTVLHTDASLLPRDRRAWAAWNALVPREAGDACTVSYCMNILQSLDAPVPLVVTLNRTAAIDPARILRRMRYHHPVHTLASVAARRRRAEIDGVNRTWFCGAWWGYGFHEDGMRSGVEVAAALGARWP
jgi:hypothetical protein